MRVRFLLLFVKLFSRTRLKLLMQESQATDMLLLGPASPHEVWNSWTGMLEYFFDKHLLLPNDPCVESYGSMLLFDPLLSIKIYSNEIDEVDDEHTLN